MKQMQLARGKDVTFQFENGLAQTEILAGCSEDLRIFRCVLKKGHVWKPELFSITDKIQFFAFISSRR